MASNQTIVLITGANQGVGFETAKNLILADAKYHVLIGSRDPLKGEHAVSNIKAYPAELLKGTFSSIQLDVTSEDSIDAAVKQVEDNYGRLDVLVNNAGTSGLDNPSPRDTIRAVYAVNVFGAVSTTEAFLPLLKRAAAPRLIFVSSSTGSITHASDPTHRMHVARGMEYRSSKTALNMIMVQYWLKTKDEGFKVFGADPGLIATNLTNNPQSLRERGAAEPEVGGERIATVVRGDRDADTGKVCGEYGVCLW